MHRARLNLILLALAVALGLAVYWGGPEEAIKPPLTALAPEAITRIEIEHPGAELIRLEKQDGRWQLTAPVSARADSFEVNAVLGLASLEVQKTLSPGEVDLAALGLAPSRYRVRFNDVSLELGGSEPLQYRRYVRRGEDVLLVNDPPSAALDADFSDLVSKALLPPGAVVQGLSLPGLNLSRGEQGWQARGPQATGATAEQMQTLAQSWQNASAMWNAPETESRPEGEPLTVRLDDGSELRFVLLAREPQLLLSRPDLRVRYTLSRALADELLQLPPAAAPSPPPEAAP
jgi:hypothetical protein